MCEYMVRVFCGGSKEKQEEEKRETARAHLRKIDTRFINFTSPITSSLDDRFRMILYALPDADSSKSLSRSRPKRILLQVLLHLSTLPQPYDTSKTTYDPLTTYLRSAYDSSRRFTTLRALLQPLIDETPQLSVLLLQRSPLIP